MSRAAPMDELSLVRLRCGVVRLHQLGARAVYELLVEIAAERMICTEIAEKVARFAQLDSVVVQAVGADRMAPPPLHLVRPR